MMRALVFFVTFGSFLITVASESIPLSAKLGNFVRFTQAQEEFWGSMRDERERLMADSSARKRLAEGSVNFFEGVFNFRDIGGKRGLGGRIVRTGLIFRSSCFDEITEKGRCRLMNELRLKTDLDLRKDCEVAHLDGCSPLGRDVTWKQIALGTYDEVFSETGRSQMREALATVFCSSNWPLAFHCKTGKDRTGTLAFVLLALLGVEEETICLDWEMSAFHVPELSRMDHPSRYDRLKSCFEAMAGKGFVQKAECYVLSLGFTMAQIQAFRDAMLISPLVIRKINIDAGQTRPFSLLHISDSHVARLDERDGDDIRKFALARAGCGRKSGELFLKAALDLAENFGERVVHTGDLMEFASAANYDLAASIARRRQFLACVGNHEFWATSKTADEKDKIPFSGLIARIFPGEQPSFVRELNGVNFFFFDNAFGRVSKEVVAAFERVASLSAPMVLVCHVPFPTDELLSDSIVANSLMGEGVAKGDSLTKSFIERVRHERLVKAILCGHLHSFSISRFSPTAVQCVANALFNGECVEVSFGKVDSSRNERIAPWNLSVNRRDSPIGVTPEKIRLGWRLPSRLARQTAYEIEADGKACGRVVSDDNIAVGWPGGVLASGGRHAWRVRVWDEKGRVTPWSEESSFTVARHVGEPWVAKWIGPAARTRPDEDFGSAQWITAQTGTNGVATFECEFDFQGSDGAVDFAFATVARHRVLVNGRCFVQWEGFVNDWRYARFLDLAPMLKSGKNIVRVEVEPDDGDRPDEPLPHIRYHGHTHGVPAFIGKITMPGGTQIVTGTVSWSSPGGRIAMLGRLRETDFGRETIVRQETASPAFEKKFMIRKSVRSAVLHVTGVGFYEAYLNGLKVGRKVLDPAPTAYNKRVLYSTYRLDEDLRVGENVLKLLVGHGWYDVRSIAVWNWDTAPWRDFPRVIAELNIVYADGSKETIGTDDRWRQVASPVGYDDIREGEVVGCAGSDAPDFRSEVIYAEEVPAPKGTLVPEEMPGAEKMQCLVASSIRPLGEGAYQFVFPQDVSGWIRLKMRGLEKGDVVVIRYDERDMTMPNEVRQIDRHFRRTASHRVVAKGAAFQTDRYISSGELEETYEPRFTYNGFRFVIVEGLREAPRPEDAEAFFVHTAFEMTGSFRCSDPKFSRLMSMADCAYRCNYADGYPTDCPHREKNGWTGDAAVASEFAQYAYDNTSGYEKWIVDILDAQLPDGNLPGIAPTSGWGFHWGNGPFWDAALTVVPWNLWMYRGDCHALELAYPGMRRYLSFTAGRINARGLVEHGLGDWIATVPEHMPSVELTSSCSYLQSLRIAAETAETLGRHDESSMYNIEAERLRRAIRARFAKGDGIFDNGGQTAQAIALAYGLAESNEVLAVRRQLLAAVEHAGQRLDCGLIGMKHLFRQLSEAGHSDLAFRLLTQEGRPSPVEWMRFGGSALWEDWGDGSSRNHIMFGDFAAWAYQYLAGIRLKPKVGHCAAVPRSTPGFREVLLEPVPISSLNWVEAWTLTPQGRVTSIWRRTDDGLDFHFEIPGGTVAEVRLPDGSTRDVGPGSYRFVVNDKRE